MVFTLAEIEGAVIIDIERHSDERGYFARTWCADEARAAGLALPPFVQCSTSFNVRKGTLRGLHYQAAPFEEIKLVRCTSGAIYDVLVDTRRDSRTFGKWIALTLSAANGRQVLIPGGVAHGFQTLEDGTEVLYQMTEFYHPDHSCGLRWNDPAFAIDWPEGPRTISARDQGYQPFELTVRP